MESCFVLSVPCASLFIDSPHIWAGGEMLKSFIFSIIIFLLLTCSFLRNLCLLVVVEEYLGFSFLQKEDPQSMYKRICNNSYNVIPFRTML